MEGRYPPPRAEHRFPNNPDLKKFWGTPTVSAFFKACAVFCTVYFGIGGFSAWIVRNEKGPFGFDLQWTPEERELKKNERQASSLFNPIPLAIAPPSQLVVRNEKGEIIETPVRAINVNQ